MYKIISCKKLIDIKFICVLRSFWKACRVCLPTVLVWFTVEFADRVIPCLIYPINALANPSPHLPSFAFAVNRITICNQLYFYLRPIVFVLRAHYHFLMSQLSLAMWSFQKFWKIWRKFAGFLCLQIKLCGGEFVLGLESCGGATLLGIKFKNNFDLKRFLFKQTPPAAFSFWIQICFSINMK